MGLLVGLSIFVISVAGTNVVLSQVSRLNRAAFYRTAAVSAAQNQIERLKGGGVSLSPGRHAFRPTAPLSESKVRNKCYYTVRSVGGGREIKVVIMWNYGMDHQIDLTTIIH